MRSLIRPFFIFVSLCAASFILFHTALDHGRRHEAAGSVQSGGERKQLKQQSQDVPAELRATIEEARYRLERDETGADESSYIAPNPAQGWRARFDSDGLSLETRATGRGDAQRWAMSLKSYGYGERAVQVKRAEVAAAGNRVEYRRGSLIEWYVNERRGVEQGFTLSEPPVVAGMRAQDEPLSLRLAIEGSLRAELSADGQSVGFMDADGERGLLYDKLVAFDAQGRELPSRMRVDDGEVVLEVEDEGASYPLTIDPLIQQQKLQASDAAANDQFGHTITLDGDTAIIGAWLDDNGGGVDAGAVYVFTRSGGVWTQQQKLVASDAAANDFFGFSVSLDGDTALIGAVSDNNSGGQGAGSAYVFTRSGGVWTEQQRLQASDVALNDLFGYSVSLSGDTAVISSVADDNGGQQSGSAYIFTRSGGIWTEQQRLQASDAAEGDNFGHSVSLSGDSVIIGAWQDDNAGGNAAGSAYVFTRSGGVWTQEQKLIASDASGLDFFGTSVSLSGDTAIVGASLNDSAGNDAGAAYVFTRSSGVWVEQQRLRASDAAAEDNFGGRVSISGDKAVISSFLDDNSGGVDAGSAYVFIRSGGVWTQQERFQATDPGPNDGFGFSVALSRDTILVGSYQDDNSGGADAGSAYIFVSTVANTAPVVNAGPDQPATEDMAFNLTATFIDADASDTHTAIVNWGDGSPVEAALVTEPSGLNPGFVTANHTYLTPGDYTVTVTVVDNANASGNDSLQVAVVPEAAMLSLNLPENITAEATSAAGAYVSYEVSANNAIGVVSFNCNPAPGSIFPLGTATVTCTAADEAGNSASGTFDVTVVDTVAPTLNLPENITTEATSAAGSTVSYSANADDAVGVTTFICSPASGGTFVMGATTVSCTATDETGNTSSGSFSVMVVDSTAPALNLPGNITAEATGPNGASVSYTASANDVVGVTSFSCNHPSGSVFSLGLTTVTCTARDAANNESVGTFTVTIVDTLAPVISNVPVNITVSATSPSGAVVSYVNPVAFDVVGGVVTVSCVPPSGSTFPVGDSTVICSASDAAGNTSSSSFNVYVRGATEQLTGLGGLIESFNLPKGTSNSLEAKLRDAQAAISAGDTNRACSDMEDFINHARAQSGKKLTASQADQLISPAMQLKAALGCP